jgi:hypothetical protein
MTCDHEISHQGTKRTDPRKRNDISFEYDERINASSENKGFISNWEVNYREGNEVVCVVKGTKGSNEM